MSLFGTLQPHLGQSHPARQHLLKRRQITLKHVLLVHQCKYYSKYRNLYELSTEEVVTSSAEREASRHIGPAGRGAVTLLLRAAAR